MYIESGLAEKFEHHHSINNESNVIIKKLGQQIN